MRGILADINVGKQRRAILRIWTSDTWRDLSGYLSDCRSLTSGRWACPIDPPTR